MHLKKNKCVCRTSPSYFFKKEVLLLLQFLIYMLHYTIKKCSIIFLLPFRRYDTPFRRVHWLQQKTWISPELGINLWTDKSGEVSWETPSYCRPPGFSVRLAISSWTAANIVHSPVRKSLELILKCEWRKHLKNVY